MTLHTELASPFERWCDTVGLHPEDWRAWPLFEATLREDPQAAQVA